MAPSNERAAARPGRATTLEGILVPRRWRASGEVAEVILSAADEREYRLDDPARGTRELLQHLRQRVRLTGIVDGTRVVRIETLTVLEGLGGAAPAAPEERGDE